MEFCVESLFFKVFERKNKIWEYVRMSLVCTYQERKREYYELLTIMTIMTFNPYLRKGRGVGGQSLTASDASSIVQS